MEDIKGYIHRFDINGVQIAVKIDYTNTSGHWESKIIEGETGCGGKYGGYYESLEEYIKQIEQDHRYCYFFFKRGHQAARKEAESWQ